jgi:multidrug resistance efflux pump
VPDDQSLPPDVVNDPDVQSAAQDYNEDAAAATVAAAAFATAQHNWDVLKAQPNPPAAQLTQAYATLNKAQAQKTFTEYKAQTSKETLQKKVRFILDKSGAPPQPNTTPSK